MSILKDIPELVEADIISHETAAKIQNYYQNKEGHSPGKLFIIFGGLGAILVGLGIILIIAHNWDELPRATKIFFAFLPLIVGQGFCGLAIIKKPDSIAWRESATSFLFFAVGGSISLVSQIYNISGDLSTFLLTWMLLCLPLIYVMKSSLASILYLVGITFYAVQSGYWSYPISESYFYWPLLLFSFPHYYQLFKRTPKSNFLLFHNFLVPLSVTITLGTIAHTAEDLMFIAYMSLFGLFYLIGNMKFFHLQDTRNNSYRIIGSLGTVSLLLSLCFDWFWERLREKDFQFNEIIFSPEFIACVILSLASIALLFLQRRNKSFIDLKPIEVIFILFIIIFIIGLFSAISVVLINILIFITGILTIRNGAKHKHLGILNYGLLIIMALVLCKFFDSDLSFVIRGILFVSVGIGFFVANYLMLNKRKEHE